MLYLRQLISVLDYMECELNYRLTPLPQLCNRIAAEHAKGVGEIFASLAEEMENQISPDIKLCMENALRKNRGRADGNNNKLMSAAMMHSAWGYKCGVREI